MARRWCPFGTHRSLDPPGAFPQAAWRLDASDRIRPGEVLIDAEALNIDASSFRQLEEQSARERRPIGRLVEAIVRARGKMHNPVTDSGGMLIGKVSRVGASIARRGHPRPGQRIATMVSLTLTPLAIRKVRRVLADKERLEIDGHAVLFETGPYAALPGDLPEGLVLSVLDVAGAPAVMAKAVRRGDLVLVLGTGKAGLLSLAAARRAGARTIAADVSPTALGLARDLGLADETLRADATRPLEFRKRLLALTGGREADLVFNVVDVPGTEVSSILATRPGGTLYLFSMATSFQRAALSAEGLGRDISMIIGSGYTAGWVETVLGLVREDRALRRHLEERYA